MDRLLTPLLGPLLLLQGRRVRRTVTRLPEPPGAREGVAGDVGPDVRILVIGDSSAAGVGARDQSEALLGRILDGFPDRSVHWRLVARSGWTTERALAALREEESAPFDVAITALGVNDVSARVPVERWLRQQAELRSELRSRFGVRRIVVSGLPPVGRFPALPQPLRWWMGMRARRNAVRSDAAVRWVALDFSDDVADMAEDGFHPGPAVYAEWGRRAAMEARSSGLSS